MNSRTLRLEWLRRSALPFRTVDPEDHDFDDLEAIADHIGDARIVQLGEGSHGSGTDFAAKSRLVAFLHQRMDFQVLVWESGLYDCRRVDRAIRAGVPAAEAAGLGIFSVWSRSREACAALEYASRTHANGRPLAVAGFDCQFSARGSRQHFLADLRAFLAKAADPAVVERAGHLVDRAAAAEARLRRPIAEAARQRQLLRTEGATRDEIREGLSAWWRAVGGELAVTREEWLAFDDAVAELSNVIVDEASGYGVRCGATELDFWTMAIGNWRVLGEIAYERYRWHPPADLEPDGQPPREAQTRSWNLRERRNAEVVRFLAERYYPNRKLILWAHNLHVVNAYVSADWNTLELDPQPGGLVPLGTHLVREYGTKVFTIGFTAHHGLRGVAEPRPLREEQVPSDAFEALCHELDLTHGFVPLRGLDDPSHPMRQPMLLAVRGYRCELLSDWTQAFDGVVYVDRMVPPKRHDPNHFELAPAMRVEQVVLVDHQDRAIGCAEKLDAHREGLLHRAFSIFVRRPDGAILLQRRALGKYHTPGLWSNTCCGHPRPGESVVRGAERRLYEELGLTCALRVVGRFHYRAVLENGLIEHEIDHVLSGVSSADPIPCPDEVDEYRWVTAGALRKELAHHAPRFTPWFAQAWAIFSDAEPVAFSG